MSVSSVALPIAPAKFRSLVHSEMERRQLVPSLAVPDFWESMAHSTIRTQAGIVPFVPFPWQRSFIENITRREMVLKSRDVGSSEICVRYCSWLLLKEGGNVLIKADKWDNARNLLNIARQYLTSLPEGERPKLLKDNETELDIEGRGTIRAMAQGGGRSERCRYLLKTERAFWERADEEEAAISGALVAGGWLIQESTANGFNDYHGDWVDEGNGYRKTFVGRHDNPTHDADWWAEKARELATKGQTLAQEYPATPEEAFVSSGNCIFEVAAIREAQKQCRPPLETRLNGALKIWWRPMVGRQYVAGADVAEGKDAGNDRLDYSGVAILDRQTGVHVADLHGQWSTDTFAAMAAELCRQYNNALLGVERNNHGHAVLSTLKTLQYPAIYEHDERDELDRKQGKSRYTAGWPTTAKTKPVLEQELQAMIASGGLCSYDQAFWDECLSYVNLGNGKTGAQSNCHDDRVIKHAIALQMRKQPAPGANSSIVSGRIQMANGRR